MRTDTLVCAVCSREVRIVRLNPETLTFGHVRNPGLASHPVRLSRDADVSPIPVGDVPRRHREGPDTLRAAANAGPSHPLTTRRHAGQSEGSTRTAQALGAQPSGIKP